MYLFYFIAGDRENVVLLSFYRYIGYRDIGYLHKWSLGNVNKRGRVTFMPLFSAF